MEPGRTLSSSTAARCEAMATGTPVTTQWRVPFVNADTLADHLSISQYGNFHLTDAIRPGPLVPVRPREGYRVMVYRDRAANLRLPMLSAAVSSEKLFDLFLDLLAPLGEVVNVVLESSHGRDAEDHLDFRRTDIDLPVLLSHFCDNEDLLLNDGCTGVAVLSSGGPMEVQFDEHKLLHVYAPQLKPFRQIFKNYGVRHRVELPLISEGEHLHHTTDDYEDQFQRFCAQVGVADLESVLTDEDEEAR
jgi:hypothetical protein